LCGGGPITHRESNCAAGQPLDLKTRGGKDGAVSFGDFVERNIFVMKNVDVSREPGAVAVQGDADR
jgi:hypothetical protein